MPYFVLLKVFKIMKNIKLDGIEAHCGKRGKSKHVERGKALLYFYPSFNIYYVAYTEYAVLSPIFLLNIILGALFACMYF